MPSGAAPIGLPQVGQLAMHGCGGLGGAPGGTGGEGRGGGGEGEGGGGEGEGGGGEGLGGWLGGGGDASMQPFAM